MSEKINGLRRFALAIGFAWLTVTFQNLMMRAFSRLELEIIATIVIVSFGAALVAGTIAALAIRNRNVLMVLLSNLMATFLAGMIAGL